MSPTMYEGTVVNVNLDRGFGFITYPNEPDAFFHVKDLIGVSFDETLEHRRVRFEVVTTEKGPRAKAIRAAD